jgi:hypothetical protein
MACGMPVSQLTPLRRNGAEYRWVIFRPGHASSVHIPQEVVTHPDVIDAAVPVESGDEIRQVQSTADRSGFVVTRGADRSAAIRLSDWACNRISVVYTDGSTRPALAIDSFLEVRK